MAFGPASRLGVALFEDSDRVEMCPGCSADDKEIIIKAVYRQVLGNAYVMESERLPVPESQLKNGDISVREFVRQVAKSDLYRSRFFDSCPRYRAIELNFKHLLGRAPDSYDEMKAHSAILDAGTFEDEIDSYLDSDEYQDTYGEYIVPYIRGYKTRNGQSMVEFTHMFQLLRGASSSDLKGNLAGKKPRLNSLVINNTPTPIVPPSGATSGWSFQNPALGSRSRHGVGATADGKSYRIEVTGYRAKAVNRISKFRRSNQVFIVPFDKLSDEYKRIHKMGGVIASITPIN
ncbi:phycobilisome linker polypeptide [Mastigocoleus testarum]|uniref:Photosystem I reaction center subunit XII n=1 Tax=Mastigocoleus testarum BC008 TaxID=371196 RepID=A0A0V7ZRQ0_9CYAN|nr:phycobilisome linker polypeptide [Mastigocoleus testarum]KST67241.1 photosystem I reaction center subunit XII [Mastigocoleus testarum BC008]